jgi:N6-L-threonylcarbamoyladenine synthase/protein kinase Bud32
MEYIKNTNKHFQKTKEIGMEIAKLHNYNIIHGDLNLINIITNKNKIYFIDFGLGHISKKIEEKATDLLVFKKTLLSYKNTEKFWQNILEGYKQEINNKDITKKINIIEKRGRYL